ncbi:hypothetical protein C8R47DRAFT_1083646 [Mycena vitilis]|nr:hypothetical protein C8R47DRAFT_1083646 [Mycena vitilis]
MSPTFVPSMIDHRYLSNPDIFPSTRRRGLIGPPLLLVRWRMWRRVSTALDSGELGLGHGGSKESIAIDNWAVKGEPPAGSAASLCRRELVLTAIGGDRPRGTFVVAGSPRYIAGLVVLRRHERGSRSIATASKFRRLAHDLWDTGATSRCARSAAIDVCARRGHVSAWKISQLHPSQGFLAREHKPTSTKPDALDTNAGRAISSLAMPFEPHMIGAGEDVRRRQYSLRVNGGMRLRLAMIRDLWGSCPCRLGHNGILDGSAGTLGRYAPGRDLSRRLISERSDPVFVSCLLPSLKAGNVYATSLSTLFGWLTDILGISATLSAPANCEPTRLGQGSHSSEANAQR